MPFAARRFAIEAPIPRDEPVMMATLGAWVVMSVSLGVREDVCSWGTWSLHTRFRGSRMAYILVMLSAHDHVHGSHSPKRFRLDRRQREHLGRRTSPSPHAIDVESPVTEPGGSVWDGATAPGYPPHAPDRHGSRASCSRGGGPPWPRRPNRRYGNSQLPLKATNASSRPSISVKAS